MHTKIGDVLKGKENTDVRGIEIGIPVADAAKLMIELGIGCVLVRDEGRVVGILTERDLARRLVQSDVDVTKTPAEDLMTSPLAFVSPTTTIGEALKVMSETHCRHLPVFDDGGLIGILSLGDLLRWMTSELSAQVSYLESYIRTP